MNNDSLLITFGVDADYDSQHIYGILSNLGKAIENQGNWYVRGSGMTPKEFYMRVGSKLKGADLQVVAFDAHTAVLPQEVGDFLNTMQHQAQAA